MSLNSRRPPRPEKVPMNATVVAPAVESFFFCRFLLFGWRFIRRTDGATVKDDLSRSTGRHVQLLMTVK